MSYGKTRSNTDTNREPITGASASHPLGTGIGAALGGVVAGAVTGTAAGPVGTAIGAAVGAVAGGLAGKGVAESVNPTREDAYWRVNFTNRPYIKSGSSFVDYGPAYGYGVNSYSKFPGRTFDEVESDLSRDWNKARSKSQLDWEGAKSAARDAWNRLSDLVERAVPGDSDRDCK